MPSRRTAGRLMSCVSALFSEHRSMCRTSAEAKLGQSQSEQAQKPRGSCYYKVLHRRNVIWCTYHDLFHWGGSRQWMEEARWGRGTADTEEKAWGKAKTNTRKRKHSGKKTLKREVADTCVHVGNHHCQFCSLQEAEAPVSLSAVMGQRRSLTDLPHRATPTLMAAQVKVPFQWQKWLDISCHLLFSLGLAHSWQVLCQWWTSSLNVAWRCPCSQQHPQCLCLTQMWQSSWGRLLQLHLLDLASGDSQD